MGRLEFKTCHLFFKIHEFFVIFRVTLSSSNGSVLAWCNCLRSTSERMGWVFKWESATTSNESTTLLGQKRFSRPLIDCVNISLFVLKTWKIRERFCNPYLIICSVQCVQKVADVHRNLTVENNNYLFLMWISSWSWLVGSLRITSGF